MSEFTRTIYLRATNVDAGIEWLRKNDFRGYVFGPENGWVQVLANWPGQHSEAEELGRTSHLLVSHLLGGDHGWWLAMYESGTRLFRYECVWDPGSLDEGQSYEYEIGGRSVADVAERLDIGSDEFDDLLATGEGNVSSSELRQNAARFCGKAGLPRHSWMSYSAVESNLGKRTLDRALERGNFPEYLDAHVVDADGEASRIAERLEHPIANEYAKHQLARSLIGKLADRNSLELDPDGARIRERLASSLVDSLSHREVGGPGRLASTWHEQLYHHDHVARLRAGKTVIRDILRRAPGS